MIPPKYLNQIVTGDARELAKRIPDESVDLIFTDPPYPKEFLPLYGWLAETAARVLKPGGLCMAMCGMWLPEVLNLMGQYLDYHWTFCMEMRGYKSKVWPSRIMGVAWRPIVSFSKGAYTGPFFPSDVMQSGGRDKRFHHWGQCERSVAWALLRIQPTIIFDPFTGGGTVPAVCKMLGRNYVAFEIDPDVAEDARERVQNTQPPLFVLEPEQVEMELS